MRVVAFPIEAGRPECESLLVEFAHCFTCTEMLMFPGMISPCAVLLQNPLSSDGAMFHSRELGSFSRHVKISVEIGAGWRQSCPSNRMNQLEQPALSNWPSVLWNETRRMVSVRFFSYVTRFSVALSLSNWKSSKWYALQAAMPWQLCRTKKERERERLKRKTEVHAFCQLLGNLPSLQAQAGESCRFKHLPRPRFYGFLLRRSNIRFVWPLSSRQQPLSNLGLRQIT